MSPSLSELGILRRGRVDRSKLISEYKRLATTVALSDEGPDTIPAGATVDALCPGLPHNRVGVVSFGHGYVIVDNDTDAFQISIALRKLSSIGHSFFGN